MITKLLLILMLIPSFSLAMLLKVKKAEVLISVDGKQYALKKGDTLEVHVGSKIDFLKGKGRVVINKRQLRAKSRIKSYVIPSNKKEKLLTVLAGDITATITDNSQVAQGISTKGTSSNVEHTFIATSEVVVIQSKSFGPLPVTATLLDKNGNLLLELVNEDSAETMFYISKLDFESGATLIVTNAFEDELVEYSIK